MKIIFIFFVFFSLNKSLASNIGKETGLEIPRYVSIKSDNANIRVGPSKNYPINIKYIIKNLPIKIIDEYNDWRKVEDFENNFGWIHKSLIKGERHGIIKPNETESIIIYNSSDGIPIGEINRGNIVKLKNCKIDWCYIIFERYKGWIKKKYIWGTKSDEVYNIGFFQPFFDYFWKSINFMNYLILKYK